MNTTIKAIKTINGHSCDIYAICHHDRLPMGKAVPTIEVYERADEVRLLGSNGCRRKKTYFSIVLCPDPEMDARMTEDVLRGLITFDLIMELPRGDGTVAPFKIFGVTDAELSQEQWEFRVSDWQTVRQLLAL